MTASEKITAGGASCTVWFEEVPKYNSAKTAAIGAFSCSSREEGRKILSMAIEAAAQKGSEFLVGPMDRTTWHSYRFVTESDGSPPFLLEPHNPEFYPLTFQDMGFAVIGSYSSAIDRDLLPRGMEKYEKRIQSKGIRVREFDPSQSDRDLRLLYGLTVKKFAENFLYTEISEAEFLDMYKPMLPRANPRYILMAESAAGELLAYLFAIPNHAEGTKPAQLIYKTYASSYPGLGRYVFEENLRRAKEDGFQAVIHALMHDDNSSTNTSGKYAKTFRRYALYGKKLA